MYLHLVQVCTVDKPLQTGASLPPSLLPALPPYLPHLPLITCLLVTGIYLVFSSSDTQLLTAEKEIYVIFVNIVGVWGLGCKGRKEGRKEGK